MHTHRRERRLPRPVGFWLLAATLLAFLAASSAPSPLYVVYQHQWGFSSTVLTEVFAVYVLALLVALLTVGGLSDHVGRRPVLLAALVVEAASMVVFLAAGGVGALFLARILQGVATGAAAGAISAGLIDLQPSPTSTLGSLLNTLASATGLAVGALGAGLLVEYAPAPTHLVFVLLTAVFVVLAALVLYLPDPVSPRPGAWASLRPRAAVPAQARRAFLVATPCLVATWAIGGLYLALGPSLTAGVLHLSSHLVGGLVVTTLFGLAAVASLLLRDLTPRLMMTGGSAVLAVGTGLTLLALAGPSTALFFVGTGLAGLGFGAAFLGAFRSLAALARPTERAELFASLYVVSYLALSVPAVLAGFAVPTFGLRSTAAVYGCAVVVLALLSAVSAALVRRPAVVVPAAPLAASAGEPAAGLPTVPAATSASAGEPGTGV